MNRFALIVPADLAVASRLLANRDHAALAGGVDLLDLLKQNIAAQHTLVNLKGLKGLDAIERQAFTAPARDAIDVLRAGTKERSLAQTKELRDMRSKR